MSQKLIGTYNLEPDNSVKMEILDIIRMGPGDAKLLNITDKSTILRVIREKDPDYARRYTLHCMIIDSGNTTSMDLHSLSDVQIIKAPKKGCKSIWK